MWASGFERICTFSGKDEVISLRGVDAVGERAVNQPGVDERHGAADLADAEPAGEVVRLVRHQQAHRATGKDTETTCPARILVDPLSEFPVGAGSSVRQQRGTQWLAQRPF